MARADETPSRSNGLLFLPEQDRDERCYVLKSAGSKRFTIQGRIAERTRGRAPLNELRMTPLVGISQGGFCNFLWHIH
jgi:hypothetical protein